MSEIRLINGDCLEVMDDFNIGLDRIRNLLTTLDYKPNIVYNLKQKDN